MVEDNRESVIWSFAEWSADPELSFSDTALYQSRLSFLDTIACIIAAKDDPVVHQVAQAMKNAGGDGPASTVIAGIQLSAPTAAMVNGVAAHAMDFDDYEIPASTHPSAPVVSALLAMADVRKSTLRELLDAYLVGYEAIICMGRALGGYRHYMAGWHSTSTIGPFGAAAAVARLAGLNAEQTANALTLSLSTSAGLKRQFGTGAKPLHAGFAARSGIEAALLAESGVTGNPGVMENQYGFIELYGDRDQSMAEQETTKDRTVSVMESDPVLRKPWPSCAYTHRSIEAAGVIAQSPGFDVSTITSGDIRIPEPFFRVAPFNRPETPDQARFSVLYCVASTLADGLLFPASFRMEQIQRPDVRSLMEKFTITAYDPGPDIDDMSPDYPDTVTIMDDGGHERTETVHHVKGGHENPMGEIDIREKFDLCGGGKDLASRLMDSDQYNDQVFNSSHWSN